MAEVRLELLLGRRVVDTRGRPAGRIEAVHAERRDGEWLVQEYVLGLDGLLERLAGGPLARGLLGRWARQRDAYTVPWDALDLADPERPRLTRPLAELRRRAA